MIFSRPTLFGWIEESCDVSRSALDGWLQESKTPDPSSVPFQIDSSTIIEMQIDGPLVTEVRINGINV